VRIRARRGPTDFFERVRVGGDVYVLSHVISNSDEDQSLTVLGHRRRALNGAVP
jgi:hypothetical protein